MSSRAPTLFPTAFGAFFLTATILISGCTNDVASANRQPDVIRIGAPQARLSDIGVEELARIFRRESLTETGADGRAVPTLAEGWRWDPGELRLHVRLRSKVFTHDGHLVTAAMVAEALRIAVATRSNQELYGSLSEVSGIETGAENEITITLKRAAGALPEELDVPLTFGAGEEGTGPYRLAQGAGDEIVLERFQQYYRGRPTIGRVVIRRYATLRTAWTSLLRGEIDVVTSVPPDVVEFISNDRIAVTSFPRVYEYVIGFNSARSPFRSAAVRRALNLAVDRKNLVAHVLKGGGLEATGPLWPKHWAIEGFGNSYVFDPGAAESLLDDAGLRRTSNGRSDSRQVRFSFTCLVPANFSTEERLALEIQRDLYDIGVDIRFEALPLDEYVKRILSGNFTAVLTEMIGGPALSRPFIFWRSAQGFKGAFNTYGYENAEVERLFAVVRGTTNETVVRAAARRLQEVFLDDPPAIFLAWSDGARAVSRDFRVVQDPDRDGVRTLWRWTRESNSEGGPAQ